MRMRKLIAPLGLLALIGCSVISKSEAEQCAKDTDCYVKFGGGFVCQSGGCVARPTLAEVRPVVTQLDECRATQECVAFKGEGWLCRRDRDDPQKKGKCLQLTPTNTCKIYGDYKNDQVVMLGALLPDKESPQLAAAVRSGLERAVSDWEIAIQTLQATNTGADAVAPPRPFAILACSEESPASETVTQFLNFGIPMVIGPTIVRANTEKIAEDLTNAKLLLVSPTSILKPRNGSNVANYFFRVNGTEAPLVAAIQGLAEKPNVVIHQRDGVYAALATQLASTVPPLTAQTYDDPAQFNFVAPQPDTNVLVLADGEAAAVLDKISTTGFAYVLPSALPDVVAAIAGGARLPAKIRSLRSPRNAAVPAPAFSTPFAFGDAEAYDAVYMAMVAIASFGDARSVETLETEELRTAFLRANDAAGKGVRAQASGIRDLLKEVRATPDMKINLEGASGSCAVDPTTNATTRSATACVVSRNGCAP